MEQTPHQFAKEQLEDILEKQLMRYKKSNSVETYTSMINAVVSFQTKYRFYAFDEEMIQRMWEGIRDNEFLFDVLMGVTSEWVLTLNLSAIVTWTDVRDNAASALGAASRMPIVVDKEYSQALEMVDQLIDDPSYFERIKDSEWWRIMFSRLPVMLTIYYLSTLSISDK